MDSSGLPHYDQSTHINPPEYNLASASTPLFRIATHITPALVSTAELKAHLLVLAAFSHLQTQVEAAEWYLSDGKIATAPQPFPGVKWAIFVTRAVQRFGLWLRRSIAPQSLGALVGLVAPTDIPPLDVLLVLHAYMMNPRRYYEDACRDIPELSTIGPFPLFAVASMIDMNTLDMKPDLIQIQTWEQRTLTSFSLPISTTMTDKHLISCPRCLQTLDVAWILAPDMIGTDYTCGNGFAQNEFKATCPTCGMHITHEALCVSKFVTDVARCTESADAFLPFTLLHESMGWKEQLQGRELTNEILTFVIPESLSVKTASGLGEHYNWDFTRISNAMLCRTTAEASIITRLAKARASIVLAAYAQPDPYSIELVSAVIRISTFSEAMVELGWAVPGKFDMEFTVLEEAVARYHNYLDMGAKLFRRIMVPTLDIDLVLHTHLLRPADYREETIRLVGRVLDHEDKVEEGKMGASFEEVATIWKDRFKTPYSTCACLYDPTEIQIRFWRKKKNDTLGGNTTDLQPIHPSIRSPTHPSDHNSIIVTNHAKFTWLRESREERFEDERKSREKGKGKGKQQPMLVEKEHERAFVRRAEYTLSVASRGFGTLGFKGWALRSPLDARVVDASVLGRGEFVEGAEPTVTVANVVPVNSWSGLSAYANGNKR